MESGRALTLRERRALRAAIHEEMSHLDEQIVSLTRRFDDIVEAAELTSTDDEHEQMYKAIEAGDVAKAEKLAKAHYSHPQNPGWGESMPANRPINALYIRDL